MLMLGLCGSLRRDSYNRRLLRAAAAQLPPGVVFDEWIQLAWVPAYNEDLERESAPPAAGALRRELAAADAVLIATPEYNASLPGQLKNALDWASRPFPDNALRGKPVAVIGASTSLFGAVWAQAEVRKVLMTIGAQVIDEQLPVAQVDAAFDPDGSLRDRELQARLADIVGALVRAASAPAKAA
jgi:chromate reductase